MQQEEDAACAGQGAGTLAEAAWARPGRMGNVVVSPEENPELDEEKSDLDWCVWIGAESPQVL